MKNIKKRGVKTELELENEIKKEKLGSEDDESSPVAALLFVPTSSMSVNEREEGTLFDTRGTRRTRRDGTRTWSTRASLIFCLWVVVVVVVVIARLLPGSQRLITGRRSRQKGTKKKKKKLIIRREGGGKGGRSAQGRKEAAMGFLVISLYYFLTALVGSLLVRVCFNKGKSTNM
jgi:hypothetical protein